MRLLHWFILSNHRKSSHLIWFTPGLHRFVSCIYFFFILSLLGICVCACVHACVCKMSWYNIRMSNNKLNGPAVVQFLLTQFYAGKSYSSRRFDPVAKVFIFSLYTLFAVFGSLLHWPFSCIGLFKFVPFSKFLKKHSMSLFKTFKNCIINANKVKLPKN